MLKTQRTKATPTQAQQKKKWVTFTYHRPLTHKVTSLLKHTNLNIAFRTSNTIYMQLCDEVPQNKMNSSGIYRLQCKSCHSSYVGQTGRSIEIRHREYVRYIYQNSVIFISL
jgi:transposase-like protein